MVKRRLPAQHNPKLEAESTPPHSVLVERRRLGQTDLKAKGQSGSPSSLGVFDYAHLRVPLPQDLRKSDLFMPGKTGLYPESYFLMRRSSDGYISATGMYKAAFPWSTKDEEFVERAHHKNLLSGKGQEVAGNVWIAPEDALKLAEEYDIVPWIIALLDPAPIEVGSKERVVGVVTSPPKFAMDKLLPHPDLAPTPARSRAKRSTSPAKSTTTPRKIASPKKRGPRSTSAKPEDKADGEVKPTPKSAKALAEKLGSGVVPFATGGVKDDKVRVEVEETVEKNKDLETVRTSVAVVMPSSHPDLPIPESTEGVIEKAKSIVEEAHKLDQARASSSKAKKRKASGTISKEDLDKAQPASKKAKTGLEEKLVSERVRTRALIGLTATLAVSAIIPYFL